jgi:FkbM family methyltransferase
MVAEVLGTVVRTGQGTFCVDPQDQFVSKALLERGTYGRAELDNLALLVGPSSRVLLVGAHLGSILVPLSKRVAGVAGVEANPHTFQRLELNVRMNLCGNVRLFNVAAAEVRGSMSFVLNTTNSGASKRMPLVRRELYFEDHPEVVRVPCVRLDELLPEERFDLVFMDIEGSELPAMRGMPRILSGAAFVVCEFYPFMIHDVAGAGPDDFLQPLADFQTLVIPSQNRAVHGDEIAAAIREMYQANHCDNGLIFLRQRRDIGFRRPAQGEARLGDDAG